MVHDSRIDFTDDEKSKKNGEFKTKVHFGEVY
jgi:hypothetical protein